MLRNTRSLAFSLPSLVGMLAFAGMCVIIVLWSYTLPFPLWADDVINLVQACRLTSVEYGTLYEIGYCGIVRIAPDYITAFDSKQLGVLFAIGVLVIRLAQQHGCRNDVAACIGLWIICTIYNINGTAYAALLLVLLVCVFVRQYQQAALYLFPLFLVAAFLVRTEYILALLLFVLVLLYYYVVHNKDHTQSKAALMYSFGGFLVCIVLFAVSRYRKQLTPHYIPREWLAFGQHFSDNYKTAFGSSQDAWMEWLTIVRRFFPHSQSVLDALRENPTMFGWHVWFNISNRFPSALAHTLVPFPLGFWSLPLVIGLLVVVVVGFRHTSKQERVHLLPMAVIACIPIYGVLVVQPKVEYLLPIIPLFSVLAGRALTTWLRTSHRWSQLVALFFGALLLGGFAYIASAKVGHIMQPEASFRNDLAAIQAQRAVSRPTRVLASWYADRICAVIAPTPCVPLNFMNPTRAGQVYIRPSESLATFIRRLQPDWVVVGPDWKTLSMVQDDLEAHDWPTLLSNMGCEPFAPTIEGLQTWKCSARHERS